MADIRDLSHRIRRMEHRTGVQADTRPDAETVAALQRHEARLVVLIEKRFDAPARAIEAEEGQPLTPSDPRLRQAIELLADDTPAQWARDQRTIETHYLRTEGTLRYAQRTYAWGSTPDDMWQHFIGLAFSARLGGRAAQG